MSQKSFTTTTSFIISSSESLNKPLSSSQSATDCSDVVQNDGLHMPQANASFSATRYESNRKNGIDAADNSTINTNDQQSASMSHCLSNLANCRESSAEMDAEHKAQSDQSHHSDNQLTYNNGHSAVPMIYSSINQNPQSKESFDRFIRPLSNGLELETSNYTTAIDYSNNNSKSKPNGISVPLSQFQSTNRSENEYDDLHSDQPIYGSARSNYSVNVFPRKPSNPTQKLNRGSTDKFESNTPLMPMNVKSMLLHGVSDKEVMKNWLSSIKCDEYQKNFIEHGYDMRIIIRMTPQDLAAIGCKSPALRKKLLTEIKKLNIDDDIPSERPESLEKWLSVLKLIEYFPRLCSEGYETIDKVCTLTWEDLEEIGIIKLGHQKRLLIGIEKLRKYERQQKEIQADQAIYDVHPNHRMSLASNNYAENRMSTLSRSTSRSGFFQTRSGANLDRRGLPVATVVPALKHITNPPMSSDVTLHNMNSQEQSMQNPPNNFSANNRLSTSSLNFATGQSSQSDNLLKSHNFLTIRRPPLPPMRTNSLKCQQDCNELLNTNDYSNSVYGCTNGGTFVPPPSTHCTSTLRTPKLGALTATTNKMLTLGGHLRTVNSSQNSIRSILPVREAPPPPHMCQPPTITERIEEESPPSLNNFVNIINEPSSKLINNSSISHQLASAEEFPPPPPT